MSSCLFTESQELADEDARYAAEHGDCCSEYMKYGAEACPVCGEEILYDQDPITAE